jgi:hypothetical protein
LGPVAKERSFVNLPHECERKLSSRLRKQNQQADESESKSVNKAIAVM